MNEILYTGFLLIFVGLAVNAYFLKNVALSLLRIEFYLKQQNEILTTDDSPKEEPDDGESWKRT